MDWLTKNAQKALNGSTMAFAKYLRSPSVIPYSDRWLELAKRFMKILEESCSRSPTDSHLLISERGTENCRNSHIREEAIQRHVLISETAIFSRQQNKEKQA
eukprot:scaffold1388_cov267-Chaetoceros_neogracile.AAC.15